MLILHTHALLQYAVIRKRRTSSTLYLMNGHAKRVFQITAKTAFFYSLRTVIKTLSKKLLQVVLFDERLNNCWVVFEQQNTAQ